MERRLGRYFRFIASCFRTKIQMNAGHVIQSEICSVDDGMFFMLNVLLEVNGEKN